MGEQQIFQPLTKGDKVTVVIYRIGIVLSAVIISLAAYLMLNSLKHPTDASVSLKFNILLISLYISVGLSVFFIHLYISKFKRTLKKLYYISVAALVILLIVGKGNLLGVVVNKPYGPVTSYPAVTLPRFYRCKRGILF